MRSRKGRRAHRGSPRRASRLRSTHGRPGKSRGTARGRKPASTRYARPGKRSPMRVSALLLAFLLAVGAARADIASADAAFEEDDHAQALKLYDEVLATAPGNVHALLRSGMLLSWDKKYDEALARYERALTREPKNGDVLLERGKVLLWSKRYDEAIGSFSQVLELKPREPWALCGTAEAYAWRGRTTEARPYYVRALEADPDLK